MSLSGRLARLETVLSDYATELDELTMRSAAETAITTPYLLQMQGDVSSLQAALQIGNEVDIALLDRVVSVMAETTIEFVNTLNATVSRASRQLITAASKIARNVKLVAAGARHLARRLIENASSSLERWSTRVWNYSPDTSEMRNAHYELRLFGFRLSMLEFAVLWHLSRGHEIADIATVLSVDRETIEIAGEAARLRMQELNVERAAERLARYWEMFQRSQRKEITRKDLWEFHRNEVSAESP
jgi:DNA-binding NarL/FixJ family response regulator